MSRRASTGALLFKIIHIPFDGQIDSDVEMPVVDATKAERTESVRESIRDDSGSIIMEYGVMVGLSWMTLVWRPGGYASMVMSVYRYEP